MQWRSTRATALWPAEAKTAPSSSGTGPPSRSARRSSATTGRSTRWRTARTATSWPPATPTERCNCGMRPPIGKLPRSTAARASSTRSLSAPTAPCSPPAAPIAPSGCGTCTAGTSSPRPTPPGRPLRAVCAQRHEWSSSARRGPDTCACPTKRPAVTSRGRGEAPPARLSGSGDDQFAAGLACLHQLVRLGDLLEGEHPRGLCLIDARLGLGDDLLERDRRDRVGPGAHLETPEEAELHAAGHVEGRQEVRDRAKPAQEPGLAHPAPAARSESRRTLFPTRSSTRSAPPGTRPRTSPAMAPVSMTTPSAPSERSSPARYARRVVAITRAPRSLATLTAAWPSAEVAPLTRSDCPASSSMLPCRASQAVA